MSVFSNELWIGLVVIVHQNELWAIINVTRYAMDSTYSLKIKRGWDEKVISISFAEYDRLMENVPLRRFDASESSVAPLEIEEQPSETLAAEHSPECLASNSSGCIKSCPVVSWYAAQDPHSLSHSDECIEVGGDVCLPNCPVALWQLGQEE